MKVLLTGPTGQLGQALMASRPAGVTVVPCGRSTLDLADADACARMVEAHRPDWVLNAGAYTAVDLAEREAVLAEQVNAGAPAAFAAALAETGGRLLQVSTDFVFDGLQGTPYVPDHPVAPLGVYGATKAAGEVAALQLPGARVLRTSWVYGPVGRNFCRTMLRLHADREEIGVVADQVGCPTSSFTLAAACWQALAPGLQDPAPRVLHWSDAGAASWYDFAVAIGELAVQRGLLARAARVRPLRTADYPTPAQRPPYSLLECTQTRAALGLPPLHWREGLATVLDALVPKPGGTINPALD